jgi:hypothetical protein
MRARLHDPAGPAWTRWLRLTLGLVLFLAGLLGPMAVPSFVMFTIGLLLVLPFPVVFARWSPREVFVEPMPGRIRIRGAGFLDQDISVAGLEGAAVATGDGKTVIALQQRLRPGPPTILETRDAATAQAIRDSLGVGAKGFGTVRWESGTAAFPRIDLVTRLLATLAWLVFAAATIPSGFEGWVYELSGLALIAAILLSGIVTLVAVARVFLVPPTVTLGRDAVMVRGEEIKRLPLAGIVRVIPKRDGIAFATSEPALATLIDTPLVTRALHGLTEEERGHLVLHLEGAIAHARGIAPARSEALLDMRRTKGESARVWLSRLELAAAAMLDTGAYRGGSIDKAHLWEIALDHDADPSTRATAARLLARLEPDEMKLRVAPLLSAVRNDNERALLRVALEPDLDVAVRELEELEQRMQRLP